MGGLKDGVRVTWEIDLSAVPWESASDATLFTYKFDEEGNEFYFTWDYPDMAAYFSASFPADANGYFMIEIWNGHNDLYRVALYGEDLTAVYDLDGSLTYYGYMAADGVTVYYYADGELQRIFPKEADPADYPPLEIVGK